MSQQFCNVVEVFDNGKIYQVLAFLKLDNPKGVYTVELTTRIDDAEPFVKKNFGDKEKAEDYVYRFDKKQAQEFFETGKKSVELSNQVVIKNIKGKA